MRCLADRRRRPAISAVKHGVGPPLHSIASRYEHQSCQHASEAEYGLLLSKGAVVVFYDDDDWRSHESVQAQLDALHHHEADVCTWQVQHLCELDGGASSSSSSGDGSSSDDVVIGARVRYFATPDGGGIFSSRLGNPGSCALKRCCFESNPSIGFPDTPCEDTDYMRLLRADDSGFTAAKHDRPLDRCSLALIDANELERQQRAPGFMTVRFVGRHHTNHVWTLKPLEIEPMAHPPECLDERPVRFYEEHCKALHAPKEESEEQEEPSPPPMPAPPANLAEVLEEAGKRMAAANKLLLLLTASVQLQQGGVGGGGEAEASASSSLEVKLRPMLTLLSETYKAQKAQKALRGTPLYQGNVLGAAAPAMEALRKALRVPSHYSSGHKGGVGCRANDY